MALPVGTVPGTQHILDSALTRGLSTLDWWPEWQRCAKVTCQWLRAQQHRDLLINNLQDSFQAETDGQLQQLVSSLQTSVEGFAEWRWKTLNNATRDLGRVREAVCSAIATACPAVSWQARQVVKLRCFWRARRTLLSGAGQQR